MMGVGPVATFCPLVTVFFSASYFAFEAGFYGTATPNLVFLLVAVALGAFLNLVLLELYYRRLKPPKPERVQGADDDSQRLKGKKPQEKKTDGKGSTHHAYKDGSDKRATQKVGIPSDSKSNIV